ncbi:MAG: hypothetical protein KC912_16355 [Proteobacteria bacterium]|nr:hypothetical protein [Pseudomonadota bacterium]
MTTRLAILFALTTVACGGEADLFTPMQGDSTVQARISGDLPHTGAFDDDSRNSWFSSFEDGWVDLGVDAYGDYGWAMLMVSGDDGDYEVIGCSGKEDGDAEFDEPAEDAEVEFEEVEVDGEEALEIRVTATFENGSTASAVGHVLR